MALIARSYTLSDGAVFVPASANEDIHSNTSGRGVVSEPNGGLGGANFHATFALARHLIVPGEVVVLAQNGSRKTIDIIDKAFGQADTTHFVPIAGVAVRKYFPFAMTAMLCEWNFFYSLFRITDGPSSGLPSPTAPTVRTMAFLDGSPLTWTGAECPTTMFTDGATPPTIGVQHEHLMAESRFGTHLAIPAAKGWHELSVRVYMAPNPWSGNVNLGFTAGNPAVDLNHRMTLGFRSARLLGFL